MSAFDRQWISCCKGCAGSNIAATTARASSRSRRKASFALVKAAGRIDRARSQACRRTRPRARSASATRAGPRTAPPTDDNAHPHFGGQQVVAIVHNGVIENFRPLKERLESEGYIFRSATDSEVIAHLIASCLERTDRRRRCRIAGAPHRRRRPNRHDRAATIDRWSRPIAGALAQLHGTYGLAILFRDYPDVMIAARLGSPLVVGVGDGEHFVASDASPLVGYTDEIVYLADHEMAVLTADSLRVIHRDQGQVTHTRAGARHRSRRRAARRLSALHAQGNLRAARNAAKRDARPAEPATRRRPCSAGLNLTPQQLRSVNRILLTACGTSWHAALVGEYLIEEFARIPVEVEYASELRYRNPPLDRDTLVFAITQSGETADTLAALREMKRKGHPTLAICNVVGSSIAQEADGGIYLHAGPEIGVASTKAFTSQCVDAGDAGPVFRPAAASELRRGHADHRALQATARPGAAGA